MNLKSIKESLIKIADLLDRRGQGDLADKIDQDLISNLPEDLNQDDLKKEIQEFEVLIPEDERKMLEEVMKSLQESLK